MKRFENAQVGDKVVCLLAGEGVIQSAGSSWATYPIQVCFKRTIDSYTISGYLRSDDKNPSLFYLGENGEMLTKRPEPKPLTIHPDKVPVDTKVLCWDCQGGIKLKQHFARNGGAFGCGKTSWSSEGWVTKWNFMALAKELTVDGITYPVGTMIEDNSSEAQNQEVQDE